MKTTIRFIALFAAILWFTIPIRGRADITVCASGCDHTGIQAAIDAAVDGDVIKIRADESFTGNFVLRNKGVLTTGIIIRSDTADGNLPVAGVRAGAGRIVTLENGLTFQTPDHREFMPNITASAGGLPAFRSEAGANGYTLLGLEFTSNPAGFNVIVELGTNTVSQRLRSEQPYNMHVLRNLFMGSPVHGQKVGVDLNCGLATVRDNWFEYMNAVGQDSIVIRGINGTGPWTIENNRAQGGTETIIIGGDDPWMMQAADVNSGATTTAATLSTFTDRAGTAFGTIASLLRVGDTIAFQAGGGTLRHHTTVRSCGTSTLGAACSSASITYDAIPSAPDTGAGTASDARWGMVPDGVTVRRNWIGHLASERDPIIGQATGVTATAFTTGGTLAAGTYFYRVVAYTNVGYNNNNVYGTASTEVSATTTGTTGRVVLSWPAVTNATHYRVFGRAAGAPSGYLLATGTTTLTDTGGALTSGSIPGATRWVIKTGFELKFAKNVVFEQNFMENIFAGMGDAFGQCFWLKSNNQGSTQEWAETTNVVIQHNICRNANGIFNLLGQSSTGVNAPKPMEGLSIKHNLFYNNSTAYGPAVDAIRINGIIKNLDIEHNTFINHARGLIYFTQSSAGLLTQPGFRFRNNLARATPYSFFGVILSCTNGNSCLNAHAPGNLVEGNVFAGASAGTNPANNLYPTLTTFEAQFQNYAGGVNGNYALVEGSAYIGTATDATDRGANISLVLSNLAGVVEGTPNSQPAPPIITTTGALTPCVVGVPYTFTLTHLGGTGAITWTMPSGGLPAGLSRTGAVISGTCTTPGVATFTIVATDTALLADTENLSITTQAAPVAFVITTGSPLPSGTERIAYSQAIARTGGTEPSTCALTSGTLPTGITLTDCVLAGVPTVPAVYTFTITGTDAVGATDPQAYSLTVAAESPGCTRGQVILNGVTISKASFVQPTMPTSCVKVGDDWTNTSTNPPVDYVATASSPSAAFTIKSTTAVETDPSIPTSLEAGDLLIAVEQSDASIRLERLPRGGDGTRLTTRGESVLWELPAATTICGTRFVSMFAAAVAVHTDVAAGGTELVAEGRNRVKVDLEGCTQIAVTSYMVGACSTSPAAVLRIEYEDETGAWVPTGGQVSCSTEFKEGTWAPLTLGAQAQDRIIRAYFTDGDGAADPAISTLQLRFR